MSWHRLISTDKSIAPTVLRVVLGAIMIPHGAQKLFGWFGGYGLDATIGFFQQTWSIPAALTVLVATAEFFGGIGLVAGAFSRLAALGIGGTMIGAVLLQHWQNGFFMNWTGNQAGEGWEYHALALGLVIGVLVLGGGRWSVDRALTKAVANHA